MEFFHQKMYIILVFFIYLVIGSGSKVCPPAEYIAPKCFCKNMGLGPAMFCSNLEFPEELIPPIQVLHGYSMFSLAIINSSLLYIPSNVFKDTKFEKILFSNTQVMALSDSELALEGLEDSLEEIRAIDAHYITQWDWSQLKNLRKIQLLDIHLISMYSIDQEFPTLPSLRSLGISRAEISFIHPTAFRGLSGLRLLVLKDNEITKLERSMLPEKAYELMKIDLSGNQLSSVSKDAFRDLPSLEDLDLSDNRFVTLDEVSFTLPLQKLTVLNLKGNEINCDCRLRWFAKARKPPTTLGHCENPKSLKGKQLKYVYESSLWC